MKRIILFIFILAGFVIAQPGSPIDVGSGARITTDFTINSINEGNHFYVEGFATIASGDSLRVKLVTPDTKKYAHFTWQIESSGVLTTYLFEGPTGGMTGGAAIAPLNSNRNSANTSSMVITSGVSIYTDSVLIVSQKSVGSAGFKEVSGGDANITSKIILKQNTTYCRLFISGTADNVVSFRASWDEYTFYQDR